MKSGAARITHPSVAERTCNTAAKAKQDSRPAGIGGPFCCSDGQQGDGRQAGQRGIEDGTRGDLRFHATAGARGNGSTLPSYGSSLVRFLQPHPFFFFFFTLPSRCRRSGTMQAALLRRERTSRQRRGYESAVPNALPLPRGD